MFILDSRVSRIYDATFEMFCPHCDSDSLLYLCSKSEMQSSGLKEVAIATIKISFFFLLLSLNFMKFLGTIFLLFFLSSLCTFPFSLWILIFMDFPTATLTLLLLDLCQIYFSASTQSRKSLYTGHCLFFVGNYQIISCTYF